MLNFHSSCLKNTLVTGCCGQLGSQLRQLSNSFPAYNFFFTTKSDLDITDYDSVEKYIVKNKINIVINCAAYTDVDGADFEFEIANKVNNLAVCNLAKISKKYKIKLIHISTDYVFDGSSEEPYTEDDIPNPISKYGKTKLDGEKMIQRINPTNTIIIRTSWLYSNFNENFVKKMINLSQNSKKVYVVCDQFGSPTSAYDLAHVILKIIPKIKNSNVELYHYSNLGKCSWYDFSKAILINENIEIIPVKTNKKINKANRPTNSCLNVEKIKDTFSLEIPFWKDSLNLVLNFKN